jgi:hypothetical protein
VAADTTAGASTPGRLRVAVCFDPDDDIAIAAAVQARCRPGTGRLAVAPGPGTGHVEALMLHLLAALGILWRIPHRLHSGRALITGADLTLVDWEISWALHRAGITELWAPSGPRLPAGCGCAAPRSASDCAWCSSPPGGHPTACTPLPCAAAWYASSTPTGSAPPAVEARRGGKPASTSDPNPNGR